MRRLLLIAIALTLSGCFEGDDNTGSVNACATKLYSPYNPKNVAQCIDVCIKCERGVTTTCATSCNLKGAR